MSHSNYTLGRSSSKSCPFTVLLSLKTKRNKRGIFSTWGVWNRAIFLYPSVSLILSAPFFPKWWLGKQAVRPNWFFFVVMDIRGDRLKSSIITFLGEICFQDKMDVAGSISLKISQYGKGSFSQWRYHKHSITHGTNRKFSTLFLMYKHSPSWDGRDKSSV